MGLCNFNLSSAAHRQTLPAAAGTCASEGCEIPCPASCCPTLLGSRAALQENPGSCKHHSKALALCSTAVLCLSGVYGNGAAILQGEVVRSRQGNLSAVCSSHSQAAPDEVSGFKKPGFKSLRNYKTIGLGFPMQDIYRYHPQVVTADIIHR